MPLYPFFAKIFNPRYSHITLMLSLDFAKSCMIAFSFSLAKDSGLFSFFLSLLSFVAFGVSVLLSLFVFALLSLAKFIFSFPKLMVVLH